MSDPSSADSLRERAVLHFHAIADGSMTLQQHEEWAAALSASGQVTRLRAAALLLPAYEVAQGATPEVAAGKLAGALQYVGRHKQHRGCFDGE